MATTTDTTRVDVKDVPNDGTLTARYDGGDPVTYKVTSGHVDVENSVLDKFLRAFEGSKASAGTTGTSDKGES